MRGLIRYSSHLIKTKYVSHVTTCILGTQRRLIPRYREKNTCKLAALC